MPATPDTVLRELVCDLNETELRERGDQMADAELEEQRLKVQRRSLNAQIREQTDNRNRYANAIEARKETREVACRWVPDYKRKQFDLVRSDTKEVIEQRGMSEADLQHRLPIDGIDDGAPLKSKRAKKSAKRSRKAA